MKHGIYTNKDSIKPKVLRLTSNVYFKIFPKMSREISRVMVRVAAEVELLMTFSAVEVFDLDFLPVTLLLTAVPTAVATVPVMAVIIALSTLPKIPFFLEVSFPSFYASLASSIACFSASCKANASSASLIRISKALSLSTGVSYLP